MNLDPEGGVFEFLCPRFMLNDSIKIVFVFKFEEEDIISHVDNLNFFFLISTAGGTFGPPTRY